MVLAMSGAFPGAAIHTSLYDPAGTFPEFRSLDVRTSVIDRLGPLRSRHRLALPVLAPVFSAMRVDAEVAVCSSSGWAHGAAVTGRKVVYCHNPARWLYQPDRYLAGFSGVAGAAMSTLRPALERWDKRAARSADRYLANSTVVRDRIRQTYGIDAEILPPPIAIDPGGPQAEVPGLDPGYLLCVSRLLAYKNVGAVVAAFARLPEQRLVVVGTGPLAGELAAAAGPNVTFTGEVSDPTLRWLYHHAAGLVAASYEDFGLTPLEAAAYGKPTAALRWGGYLDTVEDGTTGVFFEQPSVDDIAGAVSVLASKAWDPDVLVAHAGRFSTARFTARLREVVGEVAAQ